MTGNRRMHAGEPLQERHILNSRGWVLWPDQRKVTMPSFQQVPGRHLADTQGARRLLAGLTDFVPG